METIAETATVGTVLEPGTVREFYKDKVVFLTGGTGFLGKLLVHKLIRLQVREVILLSRPKKGKTVLERMDAMFNDPVFQNLNSLVPTFRQHIRIFDGDMAEENIGFDKDAQNYVINHAQIVLHAAADVRFDQTIKKAILTNVRGTRDLLRLVVQIKRLEAFVFISTAYSNCNEHVVQEKFYPPPVGPEKMVGLVETLNEQLEKSMEKVKNDIIHPWPNTYAYSKALTEDVVRCFAEVVPTAIVRPSIVLSTISDPLPGWSDNIYSVNGVVVGVALGIIRVLLGDLQKKADLIPADIVIDGVLCAAHRVAADAKASIPEPKIYNCVSNVENPITWGDCLNLSKEIGDTMPPLRSLWYIAFVVTQSHLMYGYYKVFYHLLPALLIDAYLRIIKRTPRLVNVYKKIDKFVLVLEYFATNEWDFRNKNMVALYESLCESDKKMFPCTAKRMVWKEFFYTYLAGTRQYVVKEPFENREAALKRYQKMRILHYFVVYSWRFLVLTVGYLLLKMIVKSLNLSLLF